MGTKEQAVNENVIREKEMGNGERETIKLRSPVRVSLELFHIFLYCILFPLEILFCAVSSILVSEIVLKSE